MNYNEILNPWTGIKDPRNWPNDVNGGIKPNDF